MTCQPLRILFDNQLIGSQLQSLPESQTSPIHLLTEQRSRVWRSHQDEDVNGEIIQQLLCNRSDRAYVADAFSIAMHNLDGIDSIRLRLFSGENQTGDITYDSTVKRAAVVIPMDVWQPGINYWGETYSPAGLDRISTIWFEPVQWRSALVTFVSHNNPVNYIDIGMMMLGLSVRPQYNFSWGNAIKWDSDIELTRTEGGSLMSERGMAGHRELVLDLEYMTDIDRNKLGAECRKFAGKPLLVSAYPEDADKVRQAEYTMIAKEKVGQYWKRKSTNVHQHQFTFLEV